MAPWLGGHTVLVEGFMLSPAPHQVAHNCASPSGEVQSLWPSLAFAFNVLSHTQVRTCN